MCTSRSIPNTSAASERFRWNTPGRLAGFYHTSIDYLVGLTDEKEPYPREKRTT